MMTWKQRVSLAEKHGALPLGHISGVLVLGSWTWCAWFCLLSVAAGPVFAIGAYVCLLAHEFGHILTARRFGVPTPTVRLWLLGGAAEIRYMPKDRLQEFWIAVVGPIVSLVIGLSLFWLPGDLGKLGDVNLLWAAFNMLPAFPLDGGRIFRSLMAVKLHRVRATLIATRVAQVVSVLLIGYAVFQDPNPMLGLIALFVGFAAQMELRIERYDQRLDELLAEEQAAYDMSDPRYWAWACARRELSMHQLPSTKRKVLNEYHANIDRIADTLRSRAEKEKRAKLKTEHDGYAEWVAFHKHEWEGDRAQV